MKRILYLFLVVQSSFGVSQVSFNEVEIINDPTYNMISFLDSGDIDNDGYPEILFSSESINGLPNFNYLSNNFGDFKDVPRRIIQNTFQDIFVKKLIDIDNDGLLDLMGYNPNITLKYYWLKNLGEGNFSTEWNYLLTNSLNNGSADLFYDYNNDEYLDYFAATENGKIYRYTNNQENGFSAPELIFNIPGSNVANIREIQFIDFNFDGHMDLLIRSDLADFNVYLNDGTGIYDYPIHIINSADHNKISFFDLDHNSLMDFVVYRKNYLAIRKFFYNEIEENYYSEDVLIDTPPTHIMNNSFLIVKNIDYNNDGLEDLFLTAGPEVNYQSSSSSNLYYYENIGNQQFAEKTLIQDHIFSILDFEFSDFNNDDNIDLIINNGDKNKVNLLINIGNLDFKKDIVEQNFKASSKTFFVDINNDGKIDIANGRNDLIWYENQDGNNWSGRRFIPSLSTDFKRNNNYSLVDVNNDGIVDVVSNQTDDDDFINNIGNNFSVHINTGNSEFEKIYNLEYDYLDHWYHYEVYKNQNTNFPDIYFAKPTFNEEFSTDIFMLNNNDGIFSQPLQITVQPLGTTVNPLDYDFKTVDLNNDGLPEIIYMEIDNDTQSYHLVCLENLENNTFRKKIIWTSPQYIGDHIFPLDFDSDGDQDILIGGDSNSLRKFSIYENNNMVFTEKVIDQNAIIDDVLVHDINNDGLLDILTLGYYGWNEPDYELNNVIFYYENLGNGQYDKFLINQFVTGFNNTNFEIANIYLYDKNLDGKLDILVSCSDGANTIRFYLNTSNLEVQDINVKENSTKVYPNPFSEYINWKSVNQKSNYQVEIFDLTGKMVYQNSIKEDYLNLNFLPKGVYILKIDNESFKIIKK